MSHVLLTVLTSRAISSLSILHLGCNGVLLIISWHHYFEYFIGRYHCSIRRVIGAASALRSAPRVRVREGKIGDNKFNPSA